MQVTASFYSRISLLCPFAYRRNFVGFIFLAALLCVFALVAAIFTFQDPAPFVLLADHSTETLTVIAVLYTISLLEGALDGIRNAGKFWWRNIALAIASLLFIVPMIDLVHQLETFGVPGSEQLFYDPAAISQLCLFLFLFLVLFLLPGLICACASGTLRRFGMHGDSLASNAMKALQRRRGEAGKNDKEATQKTKEMTAGARRPQNEKEALRPKPKDATLNGWIRAIFASIMGVCALAATACLFVYLLEVVVPMKPLTEERALVIFEDFDLTPTALDMRNACINAGLPARPTAQAAVDGVNALEGSLKPFGLESASRPY